MSIEKICMRLFNVYADTNEQGVACSYKDCMNWNFIFVQDGQIVQYVSERAYNCAKSVFGYRVESMYNSLYNKVSTVRNMDPYEYYYNQIMHYMSTYGMEEAGLPSINMIPYKELGFKDDFIPATANKIKVIHLVTATELAEMAKKFVKTAKSSPYVNSDFFKHFGNIKEDDIKSFELKCYYYDAHGIAPSQPQDVIRYLVYKATGNALMVKDSRTLEALGNYTKNNHLFVERILATADNYKLASIFYRCKPYFLAIKNGTSSNELRWRVNHIRRLAKTHHKPLPQNSIRDFSSVVDADLDKAFTILNKADVRQLIGLYNYYINKKNNDTNVYYIRNGKAFVTENKAVRDTYCYIIYKAIRNKVEDMYSGKKFFVPIDYAAPVSEKQMVGVIPQGTKIPLNKAKSYSFGIFWKNHNDRRVDLDLHLQSVVSSYGWNSSYMGDNVTYSGDVTDGAGSGATEVYAIAPNQKEDEIFNLYVSNFNGVADAPFKFFINEGYTDEFADATRLIAPPIEFKANGTQILGVISKDNFIFCNRNMGNTRVPSQYGKDMATAFYNSLINVMPLKHFIEIAGGEIVGEPSDDVVDLSPENLNPQTLLSIVDGTYEFN